MAAKQQPIARPVKLQIKRNGAWANVLEFDASNGDAMLAAAELFAHDTHADRVSLRIAVPGDTAPLMTWSLAKGWVPWRGN